LAQFYRQWMQTVCVRAKRAFDFVESRFRARRAGVDIRIGCGDR
jgi:hypothetical protein